MQDCTIVSNSTDTPVITGTDITVAYILESLCLDESIDTICRDHHLTREQVHAALSYAERNLSQSKHYKTLDSILEGRTYDGGLDYSLLAENAGYFSPDACPLHLLHGYRTRTRHNLRKGAP